MVKLNLVVLDGEVAVPCNLQSAIAGLKTKKRQYQSLFEIKSGVETSIHRNDSFLKPVRSGRKQR